MKIPSGDVSGRNVGLIYRWTKRCLDVSVSLAMLLLSAPLWPLVAVAVKLEDGGPVFYRQERVGREGKRFTVVKFRSLSIATSTEGRIAHRHDSDVTRVGRLLRQTALDELPQLLNIVRGEMSLVGPRALLPVGVSVGGEDCEVDIASVPGFKARTSVKPGLTGLAQVYARRNISYRNKFRYDKIYVANRGVMLDLKLIAVSIIRSVSAGWG